jgi:hypothetical protein
MESNERPKALPVRIKIFSNCGAAFSAGRSAPATLNRRPMPCGRRLFLWSGP